MPRTRLLRSTLATAACTLLLAACGGGGGSGGNAIGPPLPGVTCSTPDERVWLDDYFDRWYFWYALAPNPSPFTDRTLEAFFRASLYDGHDSRFPADRWSYMEPEADHDLFFEAGRTLGYGLFVAGLEVLGNPNQPLRVRYVEPLSNAALQGVQRGDQIISAGGRTAAQIISSDDFGVFTPTAAGQALVLVLRRGGEERTVTLQASAYTLSPVTLARVVQTPGGRAMGYLHVKDMIDQAEAGINSAFAQFRSAGVQELVIDLRYNGGGYVALAGKLAAHVSANRTAGRTFTRLLFNDKRASAENSSLNFESPSSALALTRVYVLTGPRTCSASELVINGLRPFVDVVAVGDTTCGKPVGFVPATRCDTVFSIVNFESVNARNEGRYFDGIQPTCSVTEDMSQPLGSPDEPLLAAARRHADGGGCPAVAAGPAAQALSAGIVRRQALRPGGRGGEPAERQGAWMR